MRYGLQIGIKFWLQHLPQSVSQAGVESAVSQICQDETMDGILVQVHLYVHANLHNLSCYYHHPFLHI